MFIDVSEAEPDWRNLYGLFISFINPRPIALVSTVSPSGEHNLAPFSFYNMVCANPPTVMFAAGYNRHGEPKDTLVNVEATREFVVATASRSIAQQMVDCGASLPYGDSEFAFSKLTPRAATRVGAPLVAESPANIECVLDHIHKVGDGPGAASVVFGRIVAVHVDDSVLGDDGTVDPRKLIAVGRLGGQDYVDAVDPYELLIPKR